MGFRSFTDTQGVEWQAWDILPKLADRRTIVDRRIAQVSVERERRMAQTRRLLANGRVALGNGLHAGWLCFETKTEKRRLAPIPSDWLRCAVATLESYLAMAVPAARISTSAELNLLGVNRTG